jgi:hypothetical protein
MDVKNLVDCLFNASNLQPLDERQYFEVTEMKFVDINLT